MDGVDRLVAAILQAQAEAARTAAEAAERMEERHLQAQAEATRTAAEAAQRMEERLMRAQTEADERRQRAEEERRQEARKPWLAGLNADARRNHVIAAEMRVLKFNQHILAADRSVDKIVAEMYHVFGDEDDRAFFESASHLGHEDFFRAHNARTIKKRLERDPEDAWANDWGPFARMACPIFFYEAEQRCQGAAEYNATLLANRRAATNQQLVDPTGGATPAPVPEVRRAWAAAGTRTEQGKLRLARTTNPTAGEPWLHVVNAEGAVIGAVDMASVAEVTREAERRTNVLLEGAQEAFRRIAAVEAKLTEAQKGERRRAKSADAVATGRLAAVECYSCHEKGHMARACPRKPAPTTKTKLDF